ncbi:MAG: redox-regulated ATPase YchF, partial [Acidobacteria bacterium]|nr:redox-regulated ATPase YchF [Acidobacteriota bacterium]
TGGHAETSAWGTRGEAHIGIAHVPDPRLDRLGRIFKPRKVTHAAVEYIDLPGLTRSDARGALEGRAGDMTTYLTNLKNVDALLHVVRAFRDPAIPHPAGSIEPARDIGLFELEMIFLDLAITEKRLERVAKDLKKSRSAELESEHALLQRVRTMLEGERPLRELDLTQEDEKRMRGFTFLSAKPVLNVINLADEDAERIPGVVEEYGLSRYSSAKNSAVTAVCGKIEAEIASLPDSDAEAFLADLGFKESGLSRVVRACFSLLGLISFFTVNEAEARAWPVARGTTAIQAAGAIHSDFAQGFIKAEVLPYEDTVGLGSFHAARTRGVLRLEGKDYVVREGDVILFRFNV